MVGVVEGLAEGRDGDQGEVAGLVVGLVVAAAEEVTERVDAVGEVVEDEDADQAAPEEADAPSAEDCFMTLGWGGKAVPFWATILEDRVVFWTGPGGKSEHELSVDETFRVDQRLRRLHDLGFDASELELVSAAGGTHLKLVPKVVEHGFHSSRLRALTGLQAGENQARRLLHDIRRYGTTLEQREGKRVREPVAAARWLENRFQPTIAAIPAELLEWFRAIGVPLSEVYGMSENTGGMTWTALMPSFWRYGRRFRAASKVPRLSAVAANVPTWSS